MSQLVLKSLSILLGIFFIFLGIIKVTAYVDKDLHKDMRKEFVKYAKVFPLSQTLAFKIPSKWYRRSVGGLEIICGAMLAFFPNAQVKRATNAVLLLLTILSVYSHLLVDEKFERTAPALVFFFMLTCRLVVEFQNERKLLRMQQQLADGDSKGVDGQGESNKLPDKID